MERTVDRLRPADAGLRASRDLLTPCEQVGNVDVLGRYSNRRDLTRALDRLTNLPTVVRDEPVLRARQHFVDAEVEAALIKAYEAGVSTYSLGREFGLHRQRVSAILIRNGVETRGRVVTEEMVTEMQAMLSEGDSKSAIARHFGVARSTVGRLV